MLNALIESPSALVIQKLYLKNNKCDTLAASDKLVRFLALAGSKIESVHLNWTGVRLELIAGKSLAVISTMTGLPLTKMPVKRINQINY